MNEEKGVSKSEVNQREILPSDPKKKAVYLTLKSMADAANERGDAAGFTNKEGNIAYVNDELCRQFGYLKREIIGKDYADFCPKEDREAIKEFFRFPRPQLVDIILISEAKRELEREVETSPIFREILKGQKLSHEFTYFVARRIGIRRVVKYYSGNKYALLNFLKIREKAEKRAEIERKKEEFQKKKEAAYKVADKHLEDTFRE